MNERADDLAIGICNTHLHIAPQRHFLKLLRATKWDFSMITLSSCQNFTKH